MLSELYGITQNRVLIALVFLMLTVNCRSRSQVKAQWGEGDTKASQTTQTDQSQKNVAPVSVGFDTVVSRDGSIQVSWQAEGTTKIDLHQVKLCSSNDCSTGCLEAASIRSAPPVSVTLAEAKDGSWYGCVRALDSAGNFSSWVSSAQTLLIDKTAPMVQSVSTTTDDGTYRTGDVITLAATFSETVIVTSESHLSLTLAVGATGSAASYSSGSGSNTLYFTYTVKEGDTSTDLDYAGTTALSCGAAGSIRDGAGNDAVLTLAAPGSQGSIAAAKTLVIDALAPSAPSAVAFSQLFYPTTAASLTFAASTSPDVSHYQSKICTHQDCATGCSEELRVNGSPAAFILSEGTSYYGCVRAIDSVGNSSSFAASALTALAHTTPPALELGVERRAGISFTIKPYTVTGLAPLTFSWSQLSGPGTVTFGVPAADGATLIDATTEGAYEIKLTVTDGLGRSASDTVNLVWDRLLALGIGNRSACAIFPGGQLKCWGHNNQGQLGTGDDEWKATPTPIDMGGKSVVSVATSQSDFSATHKPHTCALTEDGLLFCWGGNGFGQLGYGDTMARTAPDLNLPVNFGSKGNGEKIRAVAISIGKSFTCAILEGGILKCWGVNGFGQLGYGDGTSSSSPRAAAINLGAGRSALEVAARALGVCALLDDRSLKCWGRNADKELGQNIGDPYAMPPATSLSFGNDTDGNPLTAKRLSRSNSEYFMCVVLNNDELKCWGIDYLQSLYNGYAPGVIDKYKAGGVPLHFISMSKKLYCVLLQGGGVTCWDAAYPAGYSPDLGAGRSALAIGTPYSTGTSDAPYACALLDDLSLKCWGDNTYGQLGIGCFNDGGVHTPTCPP
jgi:hypothetical protein